MRDYLVDLDAKIVHTIRVTATDPEHAKRDAEKQFRALIDEAGFNAESLEAYEVEDDS